MKKTLLTVLAGAACLVGMTGMANAAIVNLNAVTNTTTNPVSLFLQAGDYHIDPIGTAEGGLYNAWNPWGRVSLPNNGWINAYSYKSSEFGTRTIGDGKIYGTAVLALANAVETDFTLKSDGYVSFFISDSPYYDNAGGMSLNVTQTSPPVPVPATLLLFGSGILGLVGGRRKPE